MENNEITFYLDSIAHAKIKNDQESFHMSPTESILIKRIIVNYYPKCNEEMKKLYDKIKSLMTVKMNQTFIGKMSWHITQYMAEKSINKSVVKKNKHKKDKLHFRINNNELELELILSRCPTDASRSEFIASIIYSYLDNPQYVRERIVFKNELEILEEAIKENQLVQIKAKSNRKSKPAFQIISPKEICVSNEEIYNYLLFKKSVDGKDETRSIHLFNIDTAFLLPDNCTFSLEILNYFKRMKRNGVQFSINDDTIYKIRFTEDGLKRYNNLNYLEKPVALENSDPETGIYCFDCSEMHFKNYFAHFYDEMEVLEPKEMREYLLGLGQRMVNMYSKDI